MGLPLDAPGGLILRQGGQNFFPVQVKMRVIDVRGAVVRTLVDGWRPAGAYRLLTRLEIHTLATHRLMRAFFPRAAYARLTHEPLVNRSRCPVETVNSI